MLATIVALLTGLFGAIATAIRKIAVTIALTLLGILVLSFGFIVLLIQIIR